MQPDGRCFNTVAEAETKSESQKVLDSFTENEFQAGFRKWQERWDRCIANYFEGDNTISYIKPILACLTVVRIRELMRVSFLLSNVVDVLVIFDINVVHRVILTFFLVKDIIFTVIQYIHDAVYLNGFTFSVTLF